MVQKDLLYELAKGLRDVCNKVNEGEWDGYERAGPEKHVSSIAISPRLKLVKTIISGQVVEYTFRWMV